MSSPLAAAQNNGLGQKASGATVGAGVGVGVGVGAGVGLRTELQLTVQDGEISSHRQPRWRCAEHLHKSSPTRRKKREKEKKTQPHTKLNHLLACCLSRTRSLPFSLSLCHCRPDEAHLMRADTKPRVKFNRQRSPCPRLVSSHLVPCRSSLFSLTHSRSGLECRPPGHLVRKSDSADADAAAESGVRSQSHPHPRSHSHLQSHSQSMPGALVSYSVSVSVFIF